jgi:hypothetical protein
VAAEERHLGHINLRAAEHLDVQGHFTDSAGKRWAGGKETLHLRPDKEAPGKALKALGPDFGRLSTKELFQVLPHISYPEQVGQGVATENPWVQKEAEKRGLKVAYAYVSVDPYRQWGDPEKGVIKRAQNPKDGRMVTTEVFADSYELGAKNHHKFWQANKTNPNASFVFIDNNGKDPVELPGIPEADLKIDRHKLAAHAARITRESSAPGRIKRGALVGERIWRKKRGPR